MAGKLREGLFTSEPDAAMSDFNTSLPFDRRLFREDIKGSLAHADMLARQGIISPEDFSAISAGLREVLRDIKAGTLEITDAEDIHIFVETELTRRIGDAGKRLHTARSRNDQVALDLRLWVRDAGIQGIANEIFAFDRVLGVMQRKYEGVIMPGYTHMQRAQPITLAAHLGAWREMLKRDVSRLADCGTRLNESPLGAGALAGTTYPIDREYTAEKLGFDAPMKSTLDAVSDRDFAMEFLSACAICASHLSRMAEEVILWVSSEFGFAQLDDAYSTGSSIMPQKRNPDAAELVRGKTGRVYGSLMGLLTVMKGIPLAYNKDMQEDKEYVFGAYDTLTECLSVFGKTVETLTFKPERMRRAAGEGFLNATDAADYLTVKGVPFRDAYNITGKLVRYCTENALTLETITLDTLKGFHPAFGEDFYGAVKLENCVKRRGF